MWSLNAYLEYPYGIRWESATPIFAPTSRFGKPEGFKLLVILCTTNELGVFDWCLSIPEDAHGLGIF